MASYAVDSERQFMKATGIVEVVPEWLDYPDGRRRPSDRQARSEVTGMPLWAVEVLYVQSAFGRSSTVTAKVTVGSVEEPRPVEMAPIVFAGLRGEARTNKAGGWVESWSAEGLADAASGKQPIKSSGPASTDRATSSGAAA